MNHPNAKRIHQSMVYPRTTTPRLPAVTALPASPGAEWPW